MREWRESNGMLWTWSSIFGQIFTLEERDGSPLSKILRFLTILTSLRSVPKPKNQLSAKFACQLVILSYTYSCLSFHTMVSIHSFLLIGHSPVYKITIVITLIRQKFVYMCVSVWDTSHTSDWICVVCVSVSMCFVSVCGWVCLWLWVMGVRSLLPWLCVCIPLHLSS